MKCGNCGHGIEKGWKYCPKCGASPRRLFNFSDIFSRMRKEMDEMAKGIDESFERDIEAFDISPYFKKQPKSSGFTIKIVSGTGMKPKVDVRTFGNIDREKIKKQLEENLGYKTEPGKAPYPKPIPASPVKEVKQHESRLPEPKITEEPAAEVRKLDSRVVVDMEIPGVKGMEDIEIQEMESSVEVKAMAGDKAYFKILTKPPEFSIVEKKFHEGKLHLEFA